MSVGIDERTGAETPGLVGFADKHGIAIGLGEECDGAQRGTVFVIELARCMDEAHRGLAAIDDHYALKFVLHEFPRSQDR